MPTSPNDRPLTLRFLGTGGSFGIPEIGCSCPTCLSEDPRDSRLRCAVQVTCGDTSIIVDTPPDFRTQCLRAGVTHVDAVFYTHFHADHVMGADDLRRFNRIQDSTLPIFLDAETEARFREMFDYAIDKEHPAHLIRPRFQLLRAGDDPISVGPIQVLPVAVQHGDLPIRGYVFSHADGSGKIAYLTDCKSLPAATLDAVRDADVLILSALWRKWVHSSHLNLEEAIALAEPLRPKKLLLTHITHHMGPMAAVTDLPNWVELATDGMTVSV